MSGRRTVPPSSETARALRGLVMPALLLRGGEVMMPTETGPKLAHDPAGRTYDVLDVSDRLAERYGRIYVVDLDGIEKDQPQLDYIQEIARGTEIWVDAGVRTGEQAIDVVVAGAFRTVLSSAVIRNDRELAQAWKLSPEIAFEIEVRGGAVVTSVPDWTSRSPPQLAGVARSLGVRDIVYSPRNDVVDWAVVRELAQSGPTWVDGTFEFDDLGELSTAGATGGIFHITEELTHSLEPGEQVTRPIRAPSKRAG